MFDIKWLNFGAQSWYPSSTPPPRQASSHAQLNVERVWLALIANHNTSEQQTVIPKMPERLQYIHIPKCGTSLLTVLQNPLDACVAKNFLCIKHRTLTHLVPLQVKWMMIQRVPPACKHRSMIVRVLSLPVAVLTTLVISICISQMQLKSTQPTTMLHDPVRHELSHFYCFSRGRRGCHTVAASAKSLLRVGWIWDSVFARCKYTDHFSGNWDFTANSSLQWIRDYTGTWRRQYVSPCPDSLVFCPQQFTGGERWGWTCLCWKYRFLFIQLTPDSIVLI